MGTTLLVFAVGVVVGAIIDNRFAPKVKKVDGKITLEWSDKKKNPNR